MVDNSKNVKIHTGKWSNFEGRPKVSIIYVASTGVHTEGWDTADQWSNF